MQKYPNSFDVVYQSAEIHVLSLEPAKMPRAKELYERAIRLLDQNTNDGINVMTIQNRIASCLCYMDRVSDAVALFKKNNVASLNNYQIGLLLSKEAETSQEALLYTGSICYDEAELRQISSESLYEMVCVVQQNVFIFNASIRDSITMFSDFPREEVDRAIELSGLSGLIAQRGEDYLCGENGSGLSAGEKQRISIARSLLKKSQVLLVDEAAAALDAQTAFQVSNAILDLNDLTRIVISHAMDENLLKRYDCVLTLKNGSITEPGSFDEQIEQKGYFYSLFTVPQ